MSKDKILELVSQMTLEEKAGLTSGKDGWFLKAVERLGIPSIRTSDGPHGLRRIDTDIEKLEGHSTPAVCFPAACATAASFDRDLLHRMGVALGKESQNQQVDILLGPGVNMKRSPLCGRNFEYLSEDPFLAGELAASYVNAVQSQGVGTSLKHFFANNQETRRMDVSAEIDERTIREIYLPAFETVVKKAQPWTIMASYNKVGGTYSTANKQYLTDVLRDEWGYQGLVTSDWGATHDRPGVITAGCDLTMPAEGNDYEIVEAVKNGTLAEADLDVCVARLLELIFKAVENRKHDTVVDYDADHDLAREVAENSMVLLKNDGILPLAKSAKASFVGLFAENPRIQGGGSSHINCTKIVGALEAAKKAGLEVTYVPGYLDSGDTTPDLIAEAVEAAKNAEAAVLFVGLPDNMESEGVDRVHMRMPEGHNALISAVCAANPNTVVVLHNGSPVEMPWVDQPKAILEAYLSGQAVGEAVVSVLYGDVNPSGHLAETFPRKLEDNPSYISFPGEGAVARYPEGLFMGYRYYATKKMDVLFPFGHGLSYTKFNFCDLTVDKEKITDEETLTVSVTVTNTGDRAGKAVVQLYVAPDKVEIIRPVRELKEFAKVELQPGESKVVTFELNSRAFAHWNIYAHDWRCETGGYTIQICENAHTVLLQKKVELDGKAIPPVGGYTTGTPMKLLAKVPETRAFLDQNIIYMVKGMAMMGYIPQQLLGFIDSIPGGLTLDAMNMISQRAGRSGGSAGGVSGLDALLGQPVSILMSFLPQEKKQEIVGLLEQLNEHCGIAVNMKNYHY